MRQSLIYVLNTFWDQIFSLRELNSKVILQLTASSCDVLNEVSLYLQKSSLKVNFFHHMEF